MRCGAVRRLRLRRPRSPNSNRGKLRRSAPATESPRNSDVRRRGSHRVLRFWVSRSPPKERVMSTAVVSEDAGVRTTPPFRADHVGSFLRPKFLLDAREQFRTGAIDASRLRVV